MRIVESILLLQMGISYIFAAMSICLSTKRSQNMSMSQIRAYHKYVYLQDYKEELIPTTNIGLENRYTGKAKHPHKTKLHGDRGHGESCKEAKECSVPGSICDKDTFMKCLCPVGLYYSQSQNACLKKCDKFAKKLDTYQSYGINEHDEKRILVTRKSGCFQRCLRITKFTCVTVEWISSVCILAKVGFFDVPQQERLTNVTVTGYNYFGQRQCQ